MAKMPPSLSNDPFLNFRPLLPKLREATGARITDEALLTYIVKSNGNIDEAVQKYRAGPWGLIDSSRQQQPQQSGAVIERIEDSESINPALSKFRQERSLIAPHGAKIAPTPSGIKAAAPRVGNTFQSSALLAEEDRSLGTFFTDVTSSSRLRSDTINQSPFTETLLQFGVPTIKPQKKWKTKQPTQMNAFDSTILAVKENVTGQLLIDSRHIGRCATTVASCVGVLVYCDLIKVRVKLAPDPPLSIDIGSSIPIEISIYLTPLGMNSESFHNALSPLAQAAIREAWVDLLLTRLNLRPLRPSLFWSSTLNTATTEDSSSHSTTPTTRPDPVDDMLLVEGSDISEVSSEAEAEHELFDETVATKNTDAFLGNLENERNPLHAKGAALDLHPAVFKSTLRLYQQAGVQWMKNQELQIQTQSTTTTTPDLHPMWDEFALPCHQSSPHAEIGTGVFYFNRTIGTISLTFPVATPECRGGILADEMGLGKTVQTVALLSLELNPTEAEISTFKSTMRVETFSEESSEFERFLISYRKQRSSIKRHLSLNSKSHDPSVPQFSLQGGTLLIVPLSLVAQWRQELEKHMTSGICSILNYYGSERSKDVIALTQVDVVLTSIGTISSEFRGNWDEKASSKEPPPKKRQKSPLWLIHWRRIVIDEAHLIKTHTTRACRAVCSLHGLYRWCLTGTPIQNSIEDLYSLLHFLKVDPWGHWVWWSKLVIVPLQKKDLSSAIAAVRRIVMPLTLRRTKETKDPLGNPIVTLPPKKEHLVTLTLSEEERQFYDAVFHRASTVFDELLQSGQALRRYTHVLELLLRLRQAACHPLLIYSGSSTKVLKNFANVSNLTARFLRSSTQQGAELNENFIKKQLMSLKCPTNDDECPICFELPDDPVVLPCCHVLCRSCALAALNSNATKLQQQGGGIINKTTSYPCPICRIYFDKHSLHAMPGAQKISKKVTNCLLDQHGEFRYSSKLKALEDYLLADVQAGRRSVVFSQWTSLFDFVEVLLSKQKVRYRRFDGSLNLQQRQSVIDWFSSLEPLGHKEFKDNNEIKKSGIVLLVSLKAGGVGLNLTAASRCYVLDPWWNPAVEEQAVQRIHRIGQTKAVEVYRLIAERTVEERIMELQQGKDSQARGVLENEEIANIGDKGKLGLADLQLIFKSFL